MAGLVGEDHAEHGRVRGERLDTEIGAYLRHRRGRDRADIIDVELQRPGDVQTRVRGDRWDRELDHHVAGSAIVDVGHATAEITVAVVVAQLDRQIVLGIVRGHQLIGGRRFDRHAWRRVIGARGDEQDEPGGEKHRGLHRGAPAWAGHGIWICVGLTSNADMPLVAESMYAASTLTTWPCAETSWRVPSLELNSVSVAPIVQLRW